MSGMSIGSLARKAGLATSAIRYYEKAGLLPRPARLSGQRRYAVQIIGRLRVIRIARQSGFTIAETRTFLNGFAISTAPAERWRSLARRKLDELDALIARAAQMKALLESSFHCSCPRIEDCERALLAERTPRTSKPAQRNTDQ